MTANSKRLVLLFVAVLLVASLQLIKMRSSMVRSSYLYNLSRHRESPVQPWY